MIEGLKDLAKDFPVMADIRGKGLMLGVELAAADKTPMPQETARIVEIMKDNGVIIGKGGLFGNVIRIKPPMTITKEDVDTCFEGYAQSYGAGLQSRRCRLTT